MARNPSRQKAAASPDTSQDTPAAPPNILGKRELIERVVEASGIKKRAAKPVIEAVLKELGDAFSRGDTLNLQPFGKGIVKTHKTLENAEVIEVRLRRSKLAMQASETAANSDPVDDAGDGDDDGTDPLAEAAE